MIKSGKNKKQSQLFWHPPVVPVCGRPEAGRAGVPKAVFSFIYIIYIYIYGEFDW